MRRYAIIDTATNTLLTVVEYEEAPTTPPPGFGGSVIAVQDDAVSGDWTWDGTRLVSPPPPAPLPAPLVDISDRQFFQQLAVQGVITQQEALDAVKTGTIPVALAAVVAQLPDAQQFAVNMLLSGAVTFERNHPFTDAIGAAMNPPWTSDQMDELWREAAKL